MTSLPQDGGGDEHERDIEPITRRLHHHIRAEETRPRLWHRDGKGGSLVFWDIALFVAFLVTNHSIAFKHTNWLSTGPI